MNDSELDEMLNQWGVPPVRAGLRERVQAGIVMAPRRRYFPWVGWKGLFAGIATAAVLFLVICTEAFPDVLGSPSPALRPPYVAISNVTAYAQDGSSRLESTVYSYSYKGTEMVQFEEDPGDPIHQAIMSFHLGVHRYLLRFVPNLVMPESSARDVWFSSYVKSGCVDKGDVVIGHEQLLAHQTTVVQGVGDGWRWTGWLAPDLGCFALRTRNEEPLARGGYRLTKQRDTVVVTVRRSDGKGWQRE
jgi:hypothetical protein